MSIINLSLLLFELPFPDIIAYTARGLHCENSNANFTFVTKLNKIFNE